MRAFWMIVVVAILSTACSSSNQPDGAARSDTDDGGSVAEQPVDEAGEGTDTRPARTLGEPEGSSGDDEAGSEALAFEEARPESSPGAGAEGEPDSAGASDQPATEPESESTELTRLVDQLITFVEQERGHEFSTRPTVTLLDGSEFTSAWNQIVAEDAAENTTDYTNFTDIYRAMDIIDGSLSLEEIWMRFGDAGVLGYYDPDGEQVVLRAGDITAFTKTVLVHELVHALDDQVFDIARDEHADRTDEIDWTFSALVEGSAGVIEERYRATLSQAERDEEVEVQRNIPRTVSLGDFETSFLELQFGRYRYGDAFAAALWEDGKESIDAAFVEPPSTSEAIIDPAVYASGSTADVVDQPPADGEIFESGVWGEAGWAAVFADIFGRSEGLDLADGWGGDRFVAWREGAETCVRAHISGDTPDALDNYAFALEEWASVSTNREVFYPTADLIRVTACG